MSRRLITVLIGITALCSGSLRAASPNILFIFSDDHRYDLLGVLNPELHTPNLDALANAGVRFDTAIATTAICSPARAAVLTGRYGSQNGVTGLDAPIHSTEVTFADYLHSAGYRTAVFGKWHISNAPADVGFDDYAAIYSNGSWFNRSLKYNNIPGVPNGLSGTFYEEFMADHVMAYMSNHITTATNPFVIWWCNQVAHLDNSFQYPATAASLNAHNVTNMPVPGNWGDDLSTKPPHLATSRYITQSGQYNYGGPGGYTNLAPGVRNPYAGQDNVQQHNKEYYAGVRDLDEQIGRVLAALEDPNQDGNTNDSIVTNTWVIFLGDNGWQTGSHKFTSKVLSYEESMRVPMIVRAPGVAARVDTNLVLNIDATQMLLDLAGVNIPTNMHGLNLRTLVENPAAAWRDRLYYEAVSNDLGNKPHRTLRTQRYKYIHTFSTTPEFEELYDLALDPLELTNLADNPAYAGIKSNLVQALQEEVDAITPVEPPNPPWTGLLNPSFEAVPFDTGWNNPGVATQAGGIVAGSGNSALVGGGGTGRLSQPVPGVGEFTLNFAIRPETVPSSDRMWNLVLHQGGSDGSTSAGAFLNIKGAISGEFQVYNGSSWEAVPGGAGAFAVGQTTLVRVEARDFDGGAAARYDLFWSLPGSTNLTESSTNRASFQTTPGSSGVTGLNFARINSGYGTYRVDEVFFNTPTSPDIVNGDFEQLPFLSWWYWDGIEQTGSLTGSTPTNAARFPFNVPSELWQTVTPRPEFTFSTLFELAAANNESLHVEINNELFNDEDKLAGKVVEVRVAPNGRLEVNAGGAWRELVNTTNGLPTSLSGGTPYELQIIGHDFGLPDASWDLVWFPVASPASGGAATNLKVFVDLENATTGSGAATVRFTQVGVPPANSFTVDDVALSGTASAAPAQTHRIDGILPPGEGFISWMASMGYDPSLGLAALAQINPAGDGVPALMKYAFGLSMTEAGDYSDSILLDPETNTLTIIMIDTDPDLSIVIRTTEDLLSWTTQPSTIEIPGVSQDGIPPGMIRREYQLPNPVGNALYVQTQVGVM